ncbi:sensor histidine kinase [Chitinophaga agrisoli]|uniref:Sensor histidine kinase n=1 Tax=Chitinophaga agrisoli TaxID=2607653 RepID=A0A5B2W145_9BACT|nr:histidine kinase [Chitinophaga agrisoli]KAA2245693.1 sensor histidine kinase [Chitinophaga agrisoli]
MIPFKKLEFGAVTAIFLLLLFPLLYRSVTFNVFEMQHTYGHKFHQYHQVFDYYIHYLLPLLAHMTVVYAAFLFLNMFVVPRFLEQERWLAGLLLAGLALLTVFLVLMVANSYRYGYLLGVYQTVQGAHMYFAKSAFITTAFYSIIYVLYYAGKHLYFQYFHQRKLVMSEVGMALVIWVALLIFSAGIHAPMLAVAIACGGPYYAVVFFVWLNRVFPRFDEHRNKWILWRDIVFTSFAAGLAVLLAAVAMTRGHDDGLVFGIMLCLMLVQFVALLPLTWWLYTTRQKRTDTMLTLQKALGRSTADLDFLRSQINPHFLFNALNTLYGTALQENATNTSEGIQRLGDMMRFMLDENHREKIALRKEVAYLHNYIALQRLRTQASPDILIDVNINEHHCDHEIAPMLLIPFVENAFKHGISLRSRSKISISLSCDAMHIYFDVYNTTHERPENDHTAEGPGIGLNNVRDRLSLLYPDKHELSIRQTATEYFVHLTIRVAR